MPSLNEIRTSFLGYFQARDHLIIPSAPLVPQNDPTLLFVNAGMVPFKNYFTGAETPPAPRAVSVQKCVRAGGKHNDLDNVGYTGRHQTFFEMLGNFSFGDYFKEGAIEHAWRLVTGDLALDPARLIVTIAPNDDEAARLWKKIAGLSDSRIIRLEENFWSMGDTGPCGTNTEIFYDHGDKVSGGLPGTPEEDGDRFVEIWNLVFMQWEQFADGSRRDLPKPQIDTGMGLERMATVLQGVHSNYDTDSFRKLIAESEVQTGVKAVGEAKFSHQVIVDHLRCTSFLVADGVTPSNEGRGYVLRRIMRRAMRHAHLLGANEPLMHRLVPALTAEMGDAYPELRRAEPVIVETLRQEEERFRRTLGRGMLLLEEATAGMVQGASLAGETAFKLYDTFGFPVDLTQDALRTRGLSVDMDGFDAAMKRQKDQAREAWSGSGQASAAAEWFVIRERLGVSTFVGFEATEADGTLTALVVDGVEVAQAGAGQTVFAIFDQSPFYAESGGQAGDTGLASWPGGKGKVLDTQKQAGDLIVHELEILEGTLSVGALALLSVDPARRLTTRSNHSAAHLLHAGLRNVLGPHVSQKGQMVDGERMRFDFSHGGPVTPAEIEAIEAEINAVVRQNLAADTQEMAPDKAIEAGAMALFGEKYGDKVRVLTLGQALGGEGAYSVELCGGTHVARTGDIGLIKIVSEGGVAAGVRRIEALTGEAARLWLGEQAGIAKALADQFKVPVSEVAARVEALEVQRRKLEKELGDAKRQLAMGGGSGGGASAVEEIGGIKVMARIMDGVGGKDLRPIIEEFRKQVPDGVIALIGTSEGKGAVAVAVTGACKLNAVDLTKAAVLAMGGQGAGGRPDFAQGGAPDGGKADAGLAAIKGLISS